MGAHRGKSAVREKDRYKTKASLQRISKLAFIHFIENVFIWMTVLFPGAPW